VGYPGCLAKAGQPHSVFSQTPRRSRECSEEVAALSSRSLAETVQRPAFSSTVAGGGRRQRNNARYRLGQDKLMPQKGDFGQHFHTDRTAMVRKHKADG